MRAPKTLDGRLLAGAGLGGLAVAAWLVRLSPSPAYIAMVLGLSAAWAAALGSGLLALRWAVDRARGLRRPPAPALTRGALVATGAGLLLGLGAAAALGWSLVYAIGLGLGAGLVAAGWATPRMSGRQRVLALAACALGVEGLREGEVFRLHLTRDEARIAVQTSGGLSCSGVDWPEGRGLPQLRPGYTVVAGALSGGVGERLAQRFGQAAVASNDFLVGRLSGHVDPAGPGCFFPGFRGLDWQGSLSLDVSYSSRWGTRQLTCSGQVQFTVDLSLSAVGVGSCARLQAQAAQALGDRVAQHLRGLSGR